MQTFQLLSPFRRKEGGFAKFTMGQIDVDGKLDNDGTQEYVVRLKSVAMDDIRPESNLEVKRYEQ